MIDVTEINDSDSCHSVESGSSEYYRQLPDPITWIEPLPWESIPPFEWIPHKGKYDQYQPPDVIDRQLETGIPQTHIKRISCFEAGKAADRLILQHNTDPLHSGKNPGMIIYSVHWIHNYFRNCSGKISRRQRAWWEWVLSLPDVRKVYGPRARLRPATGQSGTTFRAHRSGF